MLDLGCGPGNSTELLSDRWPFAEVLGVDNSPEMLVRARRDLPTATFVEADIASYRPDRPVDVLFANASLHFLPEHKTLLPELFACVAEEGAFAFQLPCNLDEPCQRLMRELPGPWSARTEGLRTRSRAGDAAFYYDLLAPHARHVDVWQTTYQHVMPDVQSIVEWVSGGSLPPYLALLEPAERAPYLAQYTAAIDAAYPARSDGKRLFTFPRLFVVAIR